MGGNWQPEDLPGQEVSADHLCGRVCMQTDDREGETHRETIVTFSSSAEAETRRGVENKGEREGAESHRLSEGTMMKRRLHKRSVLVRTRDTDGQEERGRE